MSDEAREYESAVEARITAEFGCPEPDAERVAAAAGRLREAEDIDWTPPFLVEKLTDAPRDYSVPAKWNWWLDYYGKYAVDLSAYEVADPSGGAPASDGSSEDHSSGDKPSGDASSSGDSSGGESSGDANGKE